MPYQLILQFAGDSLFDYDAMIALEEQLIVVLGKSADVDGHDCGQGETNIFIVTDDPVSAFQQVRSSLARSGYLPLMCVGYRNVSGEGFTVLWPEGFTGTFAVR